MREGRFWLALAVLLTGCARHDTQTSLDTLDNQLTATNAADPAATAALRDQIMVDPALTAQANDDTLRPPPRPYAAPVPAADVAAPAAMVDDAALMHAPAPAPGGCTECDAARSALTLGQLAANEPATAAPDCAARVGYSANWANRLPPDLPLFPGATLAEAAGTDGQGCALRIVSFVTTAQRPTLIDWYYTRARRAGYAVAQGADPRQRMLGGTRRSDGAAFLLLARTGPGGGSSADLMVNDGR